MSPNVQTTTFDRSHYTPNFTNEVGAFVGYFEKGPVNTPVFITDINEFKHTFGRGIGLYHQDWYQVYNYLQYSSGIWIVRASGAQVWSATNGGERFDNFNSDDWNELIDNNALTYPDDIRVIAKTPGESGNLIQVAFIQKWAYDENIKVGHGYHVRDIFSFFENGFYGFVVFRKDKIVEKYYLAADELDQLNDSKYAFIKVNPEIDINSITPKVNVSPGEWTDIIRLENGSTNLATDADLKTGYDILKHKDSYDIDIMIGNQRDNALAVEFAESRRDCIAFIGIPTSDVLWLKSEETYNNEVLYTEGGLPIALYEIKHNKTLNDRTLERLNEEIARIPNSQFVHFTANLKMQYDGFSGQNKLVNLAADAAGLKAQASLISPWTPGAGLEKGVILTGEMYLNLSEKQKDTLYKQGLNLTDGPILSTQKTFYTKPSSFNRINVRSMFNHLEKAVEKLSRKHIFEENREAVRRIISNEVKQLLVQFKSNKGITAGRVHVYPDQSNPSAIIVDIIVKPTYMTEFINLRMNNVGTNTITSVVSNTIG